jgi:hypothetical protein
MKLEPQKENNFQLYIVQRVKDLLYFAYSLTTVVGSTSVPDWPKSQHIYLFI